MLGFFVDEKKVVAWRLGDFIGQRREAIVARIFLALHDSCLRCTVRTQYSRVELSSTYSRMTKDRAPKDL